MLEFAYKNCSKSTPPNGPSQRDKEIKIQEVEFRISRFLGFINFHYEDVDHDILRSYCKKHFSLFVTHAAFSGPIKGEKPLIKFFSQYISIWA
jgi:hypothetical protein